MRLHHQDMRVDCYFGPPNLRDQFSQRANGQVFYSVVRNEGEIEDVVNGSRLFSHPRPFARKVRTVAAFG